MKLRSVESRPKYRFLCYSQYISTSIPFHATHKGRKKNIFECSKDVVVENVAYSHSESHSGYVNTISDAEKVNEHIILLGVPKTHRLRHVNL